jgi:hypothetical protein
MKSFVLTVLAVLLLSTPSLADSNRLRMEGKDVVVDSHAKLMWQYGKSHKPFKTEEAARNYVKGLRLGGFDDWRLPTLSERWDLVQVYMYKNNGNINFPKPKSKYWTTETEKGVAPIKLDFSCLCMANQEVEYRSKGYVRAVRGPITND